MRANLSAFLCLAFEVACTSGTSTAPNGLPGLPGLSDGGGSGLADASSTRGAGDGGSGAEGDGGTGAPVGASCHFTTDCASTLVCDRTAGQCQQCRVTDDCPSGQRCQSGSCTASKACSGDLDCQADGLVCDTSAGTCVDCNAAGDCGSITSDEACLGHSCIASKACTSTKDCPALFVCATANPPAWPAGFLGKGCQECGASSDCPGGSACSGGLCYAVCSAAGRACGTYEGASCGVCPNAGTCASTGVACSSVFADGLAGFAAGSPTSFAITPPAFFLGSGGGIYRVDRTTTATAMIDTVEYNNSVVANSTDVFYDSTATVTTIMRVPQTGSVRATLYTISPPGGGICYEIAADDTNVYCVIGGANDNSGWGLFAIPIASPSALQLTFGDEPSLLRPKNGRVYYSEVNGHAIKYTTPAGVTQLVASTAEDPSTLEVDDTYVYFGLTDGIYRVPLDGGSAQLWVPLAVGGNTPYAVAAIGAGAVFVQAPTGGLLRIDALTGSVETILGAMDPSIAPFGVDGTTLWGCPGGAIVRVDLL
jgi:hypothetical protein